MEENAFRLQAPWPPAGDQPGAISRLTEGLLRGDRCQTLLGVTGSGKTFTVASVIQNFQRPTLVLAHNKTLAAQLYSEFKGFFPDNAVHYFVSYYDYYQPEAYLPGSDVYIEKDASINDQIERMRLATTKSLIERRDVIVVASVSCIYGMGKRENYEDAVVSFSVGERWKRRAFLESLMKSYYERNDLDLSPGKFRVRGDVVELYPVYSDKSLRFSFFDEELESIDEVEPISGKTVARRERVSVFPAQHYVTSDNAVAEAMVKIRAELEERLEFFRSQKSFLEAQRLESRTKYDMEMLAEAGYCSGIENYSRYLDGREAGEQPGTLLDFFPPDFLMVVDESHITLPQVRGMFNGDRARKEVLVEHGFRLPSCLDNRPLKWNEFENFMQRVICCSATPGDWEIQRSSQVVEQVIRPTGVVDPEVFVRPASGQVDDLLDEIARATEAGGRVLVTTLTKKMAEDLAEYAGKLGVKAKYIHSELDAFERADLIRELREGSVDVLVGINLLREGIDMPEVTLVAILDADREGFLRSYRSLIQIMGRAARNTESRVILYADTQTDSIRQACAESSRRRQKQLEFNKAHGIVPRTVSKSVSRLLPELEFEEAPEAAASKAEEEQMDCATIEKLMWESVKKLQFEKAAMLRDRLAELRNQEIEAAGKLRVASPKGRGTSRRDGSHRHSRS
ncbi:MULTISPECIES: excinuclease ABC subunit UvrB [Jonquetella]|uniref:UvrABC system protein B n=1 Tax=Jonquetella anthropi DSM 22815 TaxID=885272 RepID=H0UJR1_9BACT|nr:MULTISPECIES: excinuclease ABC subunit UvrB [Jonquetella]EHM12920.1 excinuclease ABC, B subunit [Jonquetella anthropi DSM 22815]ERL24053.1 excinuclease ABC, B subunit [Jonquetella sp. BV3C21]